MLLFMSGRDNKNMKSYDCLIIEDDKNLAANIAEYFTYNGLNVQVCDNGKAAYELLSECDISVILLDINLKQESGYDICKSLRKIKSVPIIFISCRSSDDDVLKAFYVGGDDFVKKPFSLAVLLAKVKVTLKRVTNPQSDSSIFGDFVIKHSARVLLKSGEDLNLKNMEFALFEYLHKNLNKTVDKQDIIKGVWGDGYYSDSTLNVHIRRLREKIERDPDNPEIIKTVWGIGYRMEG